MTQNTSLGVPQTTEEMKMSIESNKDVIRQAYGAVSRGDADGFLACACDDITFTLYGKHRFARTFTGKQDLVDNLLVPMGETLGGLMQIEITNLIGEGDYVVMEALGWSDIKAGGTYNNTYCLVFEMRDGKIKAVREYLDTERVTEVFGAIDERA